MLNRVYGAQPCIALCPKVICDELFVNRPLFCDTRRHFDSAIDDGDWGCPLSMEEVLIPGQVWCLDWLI
jgi:hypothetical protein